MVFLGGSSFPVDRGHQSQASLSRTAARLLALAQFQEQICMLRLRPLRPCSPFPTLFPRFFVYYGHLDRRFEPGARSPLHGEILSFRLDPLHVCSKLRARVLVGHCGRALVSEKGQWTSFWSPSAWCRPAYSQTASVCHSLSQQPDCLRLPLFIPTARLPAFATLYPNSKTACVCHSLSQQPDCQRLLPSIPTARLPAFATLYPNSQTASVCHSLSQQPDCQRVPLFIPTARLPAFATLYPNSQTASVCHSLSQQPDCQRLPLFIPTARLPAFATLYPNSHAVSRHGAPP